MRTLFTHPRSSGMMGGRSTVSWPFATADEVGVEVFAFFDGGIFLTLPCCAIEGFGHAQSEGGGGDEA